MSILLRFVSLILIAAALVLLGADLVSSLEKGGQISVHSIEQVWTMFGQAGVADFKAWVARTLPAAMHGFVYSALALPAWAFTGVLGVVLGFLFGRHTPEQA